MYSLGYGLSHLLGGPAGCRERFCVFTYRICILNQLAGLATYCQSNARYSWSIFRKISPYNLPDRPVDMALILANLAAAEQTTKAQVTLIHLKKHQRLQFRICHRMT